MNSDKQTSQSTETTDPIQTCLQVVKEAIEDLKGKNVTMLDVTALTEIMDYIVIAEATSKRHVKAVADNVNVATKQAGFLPLGREGGRDSDWTLVDIDSVVVHIMTPQAREYYDLEGLWSSPEELAKLAMQHRR